MLADRKPRFTMRGKLRPVRNRHEEIDRLHDVLFEGGRPRPHVTPGYRMHESELTLGEAMAELDGSPPAIPDLDAGMTAEEMRANLEIRIQRWKDAGYISQDWEPGDGPDVEIVGEDSE